jgi:hypothetical protein
MAETENKENMEKVRELMQGAEKVRLGGELQEGVPIDYTSVYGNEYKGTVIFKRPTMKDYMKMGAVKSEYLRQAGVVNINLVDNTVKEMAQIMGTLSTVIVKCPEWLVDLGAIKEPDVLFHVYDQYDEWESSFRKSNTPEPDGAGEPTE